MTRAQFAAAIGAPEKWVHNAAAALGGPVRYTPANARRLAVARAIQTAVPVALRVADRWGVAALAGARRGALVEVVPVAGAVGVTIDLSHILSVFTARLGQALHDEPRTRGRRPHRPAGGRVTGRDARARAKANGLDVSLIDANLRRSPAERLRLLDANAAFLAAVRNPHREPAVPTHHRS